MRTEQRKYASSENKGSLGIRRAERKLRAGARTGFRAGELVVGTRSVRTFTFNGRSGVGNSGAILKVCQE